MNWRAVASFWGFMLVILALAALVAAVMLPIVWGVWVLFGKAAGIVAAIVVPLLLASLVGGMAEGKRRR